MGAGTARLPPGCRAKRRDALYHGNTMCAAAPCQPTLPARCSLCIPADGVPDQDHSWQRVEVCTGAGQSDAMKAHFEDRQLGRQAASPWLSERLPRRPAIPLRPATLASNAAALAGAPHGASGGGSHAHIQQCRQGRHHILHACASRRRPMWLWGCWGAEVFRLPAQQSL